MIQQSWSLVFTKGVETLCAHRMLIPALLKCQNLEIYMWWNIIQHRKEMRNQAIKRHSGKLMIFTKWKKPIWRDYLLCDSIYMTFQKRQNYGDSKKINGCQRLGGGRMNRWGTQDFLGQWKSVWHHNGRFIAYVSLNSQKV